MGANQAQLEIIVPTFNEGKGVVHFFNNVDQVLTPLNWDWRICFVNDGSQDQTIHEIKKLADQHPGKVRFVDLFSNVGHQAAVCAGIDNFTGDVGVIMDCDLEHPPSLIPVMLKKWEQGSPHVQAVRENSQGFFKRWTGFMFYRLFSLISGIKLKAGSADFRLFDKSVIEALQRKFDFKRSVFVRGAFHSLKIHTEEVYFKTGDRSQGESKFTLRKMIQLFRQGVFSFSVVPLRIMFVLGIFLMFASFMYGVYSIVMYFTNGSVVTGWTSTVILLSFFQGLMIFFMGVLGEYIATVFSNSTSKSDYLIKEIHE